MFRGSVGSYFSYFDVAFIFVVVVGGCREMKKKEGVFYYPRHFRKEILRYLSKRFIKSRWFYTLIAMSVHEDTF